MNNNPYGSNGSANAENNVNKHDDMPDISDNTAATTAASKNGGLLGNLPPLKGTAVGGAVAGGRHHHGPISDPIFLNNAKSNKKKPL